MFVQRMTPALRLTYSARPRAMQLQAIGRRMQSTGEHTTDPKTKAKLVFRFGPKDVPIELWPMGAVVIAGVTGAGFAISRHFYKDDDLRLQKSPILGSK